MEPEEITPLKKIVQIQEEEAVLTANDFLSSGARIWNLFMMFIVLVGALPILFPHWVYIENRSLVLVIVGMVFLTSFFYEIWRTKLEKKRKSTVLIVNLQLLTRVILLTCFLHFFGRINGPFFVLYLLIVMESFMNQNVLLSNLIVSFMVLVTALEFLWLLFAGEIDLSFVILVGFMIRIIAVVFMHAYGSVLSQKKVSEAQAWGKTQKNNDKIKKLAIELRRMNVKLSDLSALKDEFVSVASHELRAPMTMIKGYISMILEGDAGKIPPKAKEFLEDAYESNDRMIRLVNNMLNVSRIESGQLIVSLKDIQIEEAVEELVKGFYLEASSHGLELKYFRPKEKLAKVRVDPDRIREVISNLIGNAINFTPRGNVYVKTYDNDGMVTVSVEDTGVGISAADQKQLFKKFSQVEVGVPLKKGSGLGLYICKILLNEFGGDIWLKSKVGKGTTFYFTLPAIVNHHQLKPTKEG